MEITDEQIETARAIIRNADNEHRLKIYQMCEPFIEDAFKCFSDNPDRDQEVLVLSISETHAAVCNEYRSTLLVFVSDILSLYFDTEIQEAGIEDNWVVKVRLQTTDKRLKDDLQKEPNLRGKLEELNELLVTYPVSRYALDLITEDLWTRLEPYKNKRVNHDKK